MNLENVSRDDWIVGGLALLLVIALLFFPWFDISVSVGAFTASASYSATSAPDGWLGILAMLAALAVVVDLAIERFSPRTRVPVIGGSRTSTRFILAAVAAGFVALKFLFHIHFSYFGWGFYAAVIITAALVYYAMQVANGVPAVPMRPGGPAAPSGPGGTVPTGGVGGGAESSVGGGADSSVGAGTGSVGGGSGSSVGGSSVGGGSTPPPRV